jgi:hypothetical protein
MRQEHRAGEKLFVDYAGPQHGFRACLGILRLSKQHGEERL